MNNMNVCVTRVCVCKSRDFILALGILCALSEFVVPMNHQISWANEQLVLVVNTAWMTSSSRAKIWQKVGGVTMQCFISEVRSGLITCGRAWTTVSSSALIPVAIFNSFSTVRESEKERERESYREFNKTAQCVCACLRGVDHFRRRKTKRPLTDKDPIPHLGLIPA